MGLCCCKHRAESSCQDVLRIRDETIIRSFSDSDLYVRSNSFLIDEIDEIDEVTDETCKLYLHSSLDKKTKDDLSI